MTNNAPEEILGITNDYLIQRQRNTSNVAEGSTLPPLVRGNQRVPYVTNPRVISVTASPNGGTDVVVSWNEPQNTSQGAFTGKYNIYALNLYGGSNNNTVQLTSTHTPPAIVHIPISNVQTVILAIQTELNSGLKTDPLLSPTVSITTLAGTLTGYSLSLTSNGTTTTIDNHAFGGANVGLEIQNNSTNHASLLTSESLSTFGNILGGSPAADNPAFGCGTLDASGHGFVKVYVGTGSGGQDGHGLVAFIDGSNSGATTLSGQLTVNDSNIIVQGVNVSANRTIQISTSNAAGAIAFLDLKSDNHEYQVSHGGSTSGFNFFYIRDQTNAVNVFKVSTDDHIAQAAPNAAPSSSFLDNSQISFYLDEVGNNLKVMVKYSNGTVKTGTLAVV